MNRGRLTPEDLRPCACCGKPPVHSIGIGLRVQIDRLSVDDYLGRAQVGVEMMLGGNAGIASVMGDRAVVDADPLPTVFVCALCMGSAALMDLVTHAQRQDGSADQ